MQKEDLETEFKCKYTSRCEKNKAKKRHTNCSRLSGICSSSIFSTVVLAMRRHADRTFSGGCSGTSSDEL